MTEPANTSVHAAGPIMQERSNTPDMLRMVKQKARQASEYYHNVGLANGNLRRESIELAIANKRWSGSHDKKGDTNELYPVVNITARSQPTTPVRPHPSKVGQSWMKPQKHGDSGEEEDPACETSTSSKALTFPRKIRAQDRVPSSKSRSSRPSAAHVFASNQSYKVTDAINIPNQAGSPERYHTLPRKTDDVQKHPDGSLEARDAWSDMSPSQHADFKRTEQRDSSADFKIVYTLPTLPNVRPRKQAPRERVHYYEQIELPTSNERYKGSNQSSFKTNSAGSSPCKSPVLHAKFSGDGPRMSPSHSLYNPNHADSAGLFRSSHAVSSRSAHSGHSDVFRRNKHHTISGNASPEKLSGTEVRTNVAFITFVLMVSDSNNFIARVH